MAVRVASIFIYPIKSCRGVSVSQAPVTSTGFRWDRQWLIVNSKGRAYTQRVEPKLALIQVELPNEAFSDCWEPNEHSHLVVRAPGMNPLKVPLRRPSQTADGVSVWEWSGSAFDEGADASSWFSNFLGKESRLVRFNEVSESRMVDPNYAPGYKVMFSDGYQFLVISQGSLESLNTLLKEAVPINRFRPNIVVNGCEAFSEDLWQEIKINELTFKGVKLCSRCKIPTINQETTVANTEPIDVLKRFRSGTALRLKGKATEVYFGHNMVCTDALTQEGQSKGSMVKVGDPVYIHKMFTSSAEAAA